MKIFIDQGKANPMVIKLISEWINLGHCMVDRWENGDVHFSSAIFGTKTELPKILRMNGAYYNSNSPFQLANKPLQSSLGKAHGVIYQSNFAKSLTEEYLGSAKRHTVIYNGGHSSWNKPFSHPDFFNIVVCSKWRRWKRYEEMFEIFKEFSDGYPTSRFHIFGDIDYTPVHKHPGVKFYGNTAQELLPSFYTIMDVGMHLAKRDACPNSVVEFISSGIPVIVSDKGGGATELAKLTPGCEIAQDDQDPTELGFLPVPQYTTQWNQITKDFKDNVLSKLQLIYHDKPRVVLPQELTIQYCAQKYIEFMEGIINENEKE